MSRRVRLALVWLAVTAILVAAGYLDRNTLRMEQARYCSMVHEGYWPDYAGSYAAECVDGKVRRD